MNALPTEAPFVFRQRFWTADELLQTNFPEPKWVVPGLLPEGLTLLAGRPKLGKSFLGLQLAHAVSIGGNVLGQSVEVGSALYVALEDSPRRLKSRLEMQGLRPGAQLLLATSWGTIPGVGQSELVRTLLADGPRLVVIDTIGRLTTGIDGDSYADTTATFGALQVMAQDYGVAILAVDHHRKGNGYESDAVDDVIGSTGKAAAADAIWGLYKQRGQREAKLRISGRDLEEQILELKFERDTGCWQLAKGELSDNQYSVLNALEELGASGPTELSRQLSRPKSGVHYDLVALEERGLVYKDGLVWRKA